MSCKTSGFWDLQFGVREHGASVMQFSALSIFAFELCFIMGLIAVTFDAWDVVVRSSRRSVHCIHSRDGSTKRHSCRMRPRAGRAFPQTADSTR